MLLAFALSVAAPFHVLWLGLYAALGLGSIVLYVLASAALGPAPGETLGALLSVPGYLAWKVWMIPKTRLAARRDAAWVRTARNPEQGGADPE
jgi:hypothetical protein